MKHFLSVSATLFFIMMFCCLQVVAQTSVSLYVGHKQLLSAPNPPQGALSQTAWASKGSNLRVESYGKTGAYVTVTGYFTGIEQVQCDYYWYWYDARGVQHTNHATTYYNVTCKAVTLKLSETNMQISVGGGRNLTYTYSPSTVNPAPTVRFLYYDNTICSVSSSGYVKGLKAGKTVIRVVNSSGPDAECSVTVTGGSGSGGGNSGGNNGGSTGGNSGGGNANEGESLDHLYPKPLNGITPRKIDAAIKRLESLRTQTQSTIK